VCTADFRSETTAEHNIVTVRPHHRHTRIVQWYLPGGANITHASNSWFFGPHESTIGPAASAALTRVPDRQTHRPRYVCCSLVARMHSSHFMLCMRCGLKTEEILTYIVNVIKAERRQHRATAAGHVIQTATRRTAASSDAMPVSCVTLSLSSAQCRHTTNDETRVNKVAHTRLLSVGFRS